MNRRSLLLGLGASLAALSIVRASSIMMGTFTLDPYKDMTLDQVKKRCRELSRELFRWECIALAAY